jgi:hypothetical protein
MSSVNAAQETFVPCDIAAIRLGVPGAWLKAQAEQGEIPSLRAGRRILVNIPTVERALLERSSKPALSLSADAPQGGSDGR